jgi:hypothetical protein
MSRMNAYAKYVTCLGRAGTAKIVIWEIILRDLGKYFACSAKQGFEVDELACCSEVSRQRAE